MVRLALVSCLLPALVACQGAAPMSLRGAAVGGNPAQNASHPQEAGVAGQVEDLLNGTFQLSALAAKPKKPAKKGTIGTKKCKATKRANQCLMYRAKEANHKWSRSWTNYTNSDRHMTGPKSIRTDCSGFVRWAVEGCIADGLGKKVMKQIRRSGEQGRTRAVNFYDAFGPSKLGSSKWCEVPDFRKVARGDVLVYKIKGQENKKGKDSGHIMIAYRSPIAYNETHDGKLVFVQKIIDSSSRAHFDFLGHKDTRSTCPKKSKTCGAGVGYVYVFTDKRGRILAIRLRGDDKDRNRRTCTTKSKKKIACFADKNHKNHQYRVGRLLR